MPGNSLQFGDPFGSTLFAGAMAAIVLLAFGLLLRLLYRAERVHASATSARMLFVLRMGILSVVLSALLLDPVWIRTISEPVPAAVVLAVDASDSMRVADIHRPLAEKLKLAALLKLAPDGVSSAQLDDWIRSAANGQAIRFAGERDPDRQKFDETIKRIDGLTRLGLIRRGLSAEGLNLLGRIQERHRVDASAFDTELQPIPDRDEPADPSQAQRLTDLGVPLRRAASLHRNQHVLGLILFSDGRHTWGESPDSALAEMTAAGIPVYPVIAGSRNAPADLAVVSAQAQATTAFVGSVVPIDIVVRATGWPAGQIRVALSSTDAQDAPTSGAWIAISHPGGDATYPVSLKVKLDRVGTVTQTVRVEGDGATDRVPGNNRRLVRMIAIKDKAKVLLIDGEARWEFHYLHTALGRDAAIDLRSVVFRQPRVGTLNDDERKKAGLPALTMPGDRNILPAYDCIILGDVELGQLAPEWRDRLEKYVAESGGTLIVVAGKRAMPAEYVTLSRDPLRRLLPVATVSGVSPEDGVNLLLTPAGERCWFLQMAEGPAARDFWSNLPPHYWLATGEPKAGAEVLATATAADGKTVPVILRQNFGFGRVLYLGIDSTWRWRFRAGDAIHHRFWGQIVQWASSDRLLPAINAAGTIRFGSREPIVRGGKPVEIAVRASEGISLPVSGSTRAARILRLPDQPEGAEHLVTVVPLTEPENRPRELTAKVDALRPGRYAIELDVPDWSSELAGPPGADGRPAPLRAPFEVTPPDDTELVDLMPDLANLERLARETGGQVHTWETIDELLDTLTSRTATREAAIERPLRRSWWLFGILIALLTSLWVVRKWSGLA